MQTYRHTSNVKAKPMKLGEYYAYRKWPVDTKEDPLQDGYLIERFDCDAVNHKDHTGYITWIAKKTFELNYTFEVDKSASELTVVPQDVFTVKQEMLPHPTIEQKTKTAPRVTRSDIEELIRNEYYFTATDAIVGHTRGAEWQATPSDLDRLTLCVLVLANGFVVTGEAACASPENFNAEVGKSIARENAISKVWPLLGYELRTKLAG